jgi:hypothetical protein
MAFTRSMPLVTVALAALLSSTGCEKKPEAPAKPPEGAHDHKPDDDHHQPHAADKDADKHGHTDGEALGTITIGVWTVTVVGEIKPGTEAHLDIDFSGSTEKPAAIRVWFGTKDGKGAIKQKADGSGPEYHAHADIPNPIPDGAKLWVEIEDIKGVKSAGAFESHK